MNPEYQRAFEELEALRLLPEDWNTYGAPPPTKTSLAWGRKLLAVCRENNLPVPRISACSSHVGEVGFSYSKGYLYGWLSFEGDVTRDECGDISAASYFDYRIKQQNGRVWGIKSADELPSVMRELADYVFGPEPELP